MLQRKFLNLLKKKKTTQFENFTLIKQGVSKIFIH